MSSEEKRLKDVQIIVPTLNAGRTLQRCLESLRSQTAPVMVTVVDGGSRDDSLNIAMAWADRVLICDHQGFSVQRNMGVAGTAGDVLGFVDADMVLEETVIEDVLKLMAEGAIGVVVPEVSFGSTYWASVRKYERSFYEGESSPEAARFFVREKFLQSGGYDERLSSMEDFALDRTVRALGPIGRTTSIIKHDEGELRYLDACRKKARYANGMMSYSRLYGQGSLRSFLFQRSYLRAPFKLMRRPTLGLGVIALKCGESVAVSLKLLSQAPQMTGRSQWMRGWSRKSR